MELAGSLKGQIDERIFPESQNKDWNSDFYGPLYIPKKGDKITLTDQNIRMYLTCIESENNAVEHADSTLQIDGKTINTYEFKQNYYFMMGDNRHNSYNSRYWGFLPEQLVIGKAMYLYWGKTMERIGKKVI